jgi:hypothetical protein
MRQILPLSGYRWQRIIARLKKTGLIKTGLIKTGLIKTGLKKTE